MKSIVASIIITSFILTTELIKPLKFSRWYVADYPDLFTWILTFIQKFFKPGKLVTRVFIILDIFVVLVPEIGIQTDQMVDVGRIGQCVCIKSTIFSNLITDSATCHVKLLSPNICHFVIVSCPCILIVCIICWVLQYVTLTLSCLLMMLKSPGSWE